MKLLALETATDACSVALWLDGEILSRHSVEPRAHARLILPMCEELMNEAGLKPGQLDCIAFGRGPGSFTGVRIACAAAQGIAYARGLPLVPVSTLAAVAQGAIEESGAQGVLVALDARMGEVYFGAFERDAEARARSCGDEQLAQPQLLTVPSNGRWIGAGDGWRRFPDELRSNPGLSLIGVEPDRLPQARHVARLAEALFRLGAIVAIEDALPVYLRDQVAEKRAK